MKKLIALLLALALTLPLFACGGSGSLSAETDPAETAIRATTAAVTETTADSGIHDPSGNAVGFARADVSPDFSVPLSGYGNSAFRFSKVVLDPICISCVVFSDGTDKMVLYQLDLAAVSEGLDGYLRKIAGDVTGVPAENVLINASHTHASVDYGVSDGSGTRWLSKLYQAAKKITAEALADLDHCTAAVGRTEPEQLNFTRRYYLENGFSTVSGSIGTGDFVDHEFKADPELQWILFRRDNQPDVVLTNWQCHATMTGGAERTDVSADFPGSFRRYVEEELGVRFVYFQGGAGNVAPTSQLPSEAGGADYKAKGKALCSALLDAWDSARPLELGKIRVEKTVLAGKVNHAKDYILTYAEKVKAVWLTTANKAKALAADESGEIATQYEANAIVSRAGLGETSDIPLYAYAFGDFSIVAAPLEMFSNTGEEVKAASPFGMTFFLGYSNGHLGYMPAASSFPNGGYEVIICRFAQGTAEEIRDCQLSMLDDLHGN